jgi:phosphoribosylaminoimidazole-succinocarboxamide synthase
LVAPELWDEVVAAALALFERGRAVAAGAGFVLADTKYEFGLGPDGRLLLIDEVHTPDSSRYWAMESLEQRLAAGNEPESFDKEPVRLALRATGYRGDGPPPELDPETWAEASRRYVALYQRLTGKSLVPGREPAAERIADAVHGVVRQEP